MTSDAQRTTAAQIDTATRVGTDRPPRALAPDLARGLMLALIALANVSWFIWGTPAAGASAHPQTDAVVDRLAQTVMIIAVDGRSYPLFAFLFGYGMVQFYRGRIDRGLTPKAIRRQLRRRHWAMILIGLLHAALLFMGDILGAYGLIGLLLVWVLFGRSTRTLTIVAALFASLLLAYAVLSLVGALALLLGPPEALDAAAGDVVFDMDAMKQAAHGSTNLLAGVQARVTTWMFILSQQMTLPTIHVAIILGWIAARHRLLDEPWDRAPLLRRMAVLGIGIGWLGAVPSALAHWHVIDLPDGLFWAFMGLTGLTGVAGGIGYVSAFALLAARLDPHALGDPRPVRIAQENGPVPAWSARAYGRPAREVLGSATTRNRLVQAVAAVGARSLTFYLLQSIVWMLVLSSTGLGLGHQLSPLLAFSLATATWALCLPLAMAMQHRAARGPAEVLLRHLTVGRSPRPGAPSPAEA